MDSAALAEEFAARGRVVIDGFLADGQAEALHELLKARQDWKQVLNSGDKLVELDRETRAGLTGQQRSDLDDAVYAGARYGFQYRYETIRVPDDAKARLDHLHAHGPSAEAFTFTDLFDPPRLGDALDGATEAGPSD